MVDHQSFMENPTSPAIPESLAASLEAPPVDNSFGDILSEFEQSHRGGRNNEGLEGTVVSISPESVFVDIGRKVDGVVPVEQFRDAAGALTVRVGDKMRVSITTKAQLAIDKPQVTQNLTILRCRVVILPIRSEGILPLQIQHANAE